MNTTLKFYRAVDFFQETEAALAGAPAAHQKMMADIRAYNHTIIDHFNDIASLRGKKLLDVGSAPQGFALERALQLGAELYVGIGMDGSLGEGKVLFSEGGSGLLLFMDGTRMEFPAGSFNLAVSMSTFEHIADPQQALAEIFRVLAPGGQLLVTFEPVWTCAYGHHLHFLGDDAMRCIAPWSHLLGDREDFLRQISPGWHSDHFTPEQAADFVYLGNEINRRGLREYQAIFTSSPFQLEWMVDLKEKNPDLPAAEKAAQCLGYSVDELTTIGLSVLLSKPGPGQPGRRGLRPVRRWLERVKRKILRTFSMKKSA